MDQVVDMFYQDVAKLVARTFPDLNDRVAAVTDAEITKENIPKIPFAFIAFDRESSKHAWKQNADPELAEEFIIEMYLKNERVVVQGVSESPYWKYYNHRLVRDKLLGALINESNSRTNWGIQYLGMDLSVDPLAIVLTFRFARNYIWCPPDENVPDAIISFGSDPTIVTTIEAAPG